jgi:hypothetical protein
MNGVLNTPPCECGHSALRHPYLTETFPDACSECPCERYTARDAHEGVACPLIAPFDAVPESADEIMSAVQFQIRLCDTALCRGERTPCSRCEVIVAHEARLRAEIERLRDEFTALTMKSGPEV